MYGIDGRRDLAESSLRGMDGYRGSRPVRIGNAAFKQSQIDICGELVNTALLHDTAIEPISNEMWDHLVSLYDSQLAASSGRGAQRDPLSGQFEVEEIGAHLALARLEG